MKALFVESNAVTRGVIHCFATMAGLDHAIVADEAEALALLDGERVAACDRQYVCDHDAGGISLAVLSVTAAGEGLAREIRSRCPRALLFALESEGETLPNVQEFDRVYSKPDQVEEAVRDALCLLGNQRQYELFHSMIPQHSHFAA